MVELFVGDKLMLVSGVRYEQTNVDFLVERYLHSVGVVSGGVSHQANHRNLHASNKPVTGRSREGTTVASLADRSPFVCIQRSL